VDDGEVVIPLLCRPEPVRQPPLGEKLNVRCIGLAAICPHHGAFLGIEVEKHRAESSGYCQIDGYRRLTDATLLGNERYRFHYCDPSLVQWFRCAHLQR
jgi:hypothetical protein